jgi:hypothetical protein
MPDPTPRTVEYVFPLAHHFEAGMTDDNAAARAATIAKLTDATALVGGSRHLPAPFEIQAQDVAAIIRNAGWSLTAFEVMPSFVNVKFVRTSDGHKLIVNGLSGATFENETPEEVAARFLKEAP